MENVKTIAEFFLLSLAFTLTLFSPIANSSLTGNGFIKLISNVSIGALVLDIVVALTGIHTPLLLTLKSLSLISLILITGLHNDQKSNLMWLFYSIIVLALGAHLVMFTTDIKNILFLLSSSLLLGIITYAMVLGHWYLVVPKLSEKPLLVAAKLTWIILALKIIASAVTIIKHFDFFEEQTSLGSGYAFNWLLLTMRVSFGYIVITGMSLFNWKLVKMRSIQSSTGILYAMTFFIFIGELISTYIFFNFGLTI